MQIPKRRHEKLQVRDTSPVYLTPEGIEHLKEKLARLKASIAGLASEARRTADYGDRSENAEHKEAKGKLRGTHRQILFIEDQLKRAVAIKPSATGKVQLGSTVVLEMIPPSSQAVPRHSEPRTRTSSVRDRLREESHSNTAQKSSPKTFQIVGPSETDPTRGRISHLSPLGSALLNHQSGDTISVPTPTGPQRYKILEIK